MMCKSSRASSKSVRRKYMNAAVDIPKADIINPDGYITGERYQLVSQQDGEPRRRRHVSKGESIIWLGTDYREKRR